MGKIKKPKKSKSGKISNNATQSTATSYDEFHARFAFAKTCSNNCLLKDWQKNELQSLMSSFKKIEGMQWKEIKKDQGLDYETITTFNVKLPDSFPPDVGLKSLRVDQKRRLYGYRVQDTFYIIWFDKDHIVCPLGKKRKYSLNA